MSEEQREQFPLGYKKGKSYSKHTTLTNFSSESLVFIELLTGAL